MNSSLVSQGSSFQGSKQSPTHLINTAAMAGNKDSNLLLRDLQNKMRNNNIAD